MVYYKLGKTINWGSDVLFSSLSNNSSGWSVTLWNENSGWSTTVSSGWTQDPKHASKAIEVDMENINYKDSDRHEEISVSTSTLFRLSPTSGVEYKHEQEKKTLPNGIKFIFEKGGHPLTFHNVL